MLSVSPHDEDHLSLYAIIRHSTWKMFIARDLPSVVSLLQQHEISVLVCERELVSETWTDVLEHIKVLQNAPALIVSSGLRMNGFGPRLLTWAPGTFSPNRSIAQK